MFLDTANLTDNEIYLKLFKTTEAAPERNFVPAYYFQICRCVDDVKLGFCDLRIGHNSNTYYGGNIGYTVDEPFRGKHYAAKACLLLLRLAKQHNLEHIIITCAPENIASQKTCTYVGAKLNGIIAVPDWHDLYKDGQTKTCHYEIHI